MAQDHMKLKKAIDFLNKRDLDGLIIYSNGTCNILGPKYLYYFAEFRPLGPNNAAIVARNGDIVLLVEPEWDCRRAARHSWIEEVRGTSDFSKDLIEHMKALNLKNRVGVAASDEMTEAIYSEIEKIVHIEPVDDVITEMARQKTDEEVAIARKAGRIADVGFETFLKHARIGITEYELLAEMELAMRSAGADDNFNLMSAGKHNYHMHSPTDRRLTYGDIVIGEITAACEGQFVQLCRTVVVGEPEPLLKEKYEMLVKALDASIQQVKSGAPAAGISIAMNKVISDAGYAEYCYPPYMRARGHGMGVGSTAPGGAIDDNTEGSFERDQVIVIHPNQYLPETGYLACGETYLVTDSGFERLSVSETKLYKKGV